MSKRLFVLAALLTFFAGATALAEESAPVSEADAAVAAEIKKNFWASPHLQGADIDTRVVDGVAHLTGTVWKPVERDLAGEIAKSTKGVRKVKNEIVVKPPASAVAASGDKEDKAAGPKRNKFSRWADDASTTAAVKSRLLANTSTKGLKINVDTNNDVVTLRGEVASAEERDLAELIAKNTTDVVSVDNQLEIVAPAAKTDGKTTAAASPSR